jgi:hypothetical protein
VEELHLCCLLQEALSLTEFELMEFLDVGLAEVTSAVAHISEIVCPPYQTVSIMKPWIFDLFIVAVQLAQLCTRFLLFKK